MSQESPAFEDYGPPDATQTQDPATEGEAAPSSDASGTTKDERLWGMLVHVSSVVGYVLSLMGWIPPLVIWLVKKDDSRFLDHQGREALNFQLTMFLGCLVSIPLMFIAIGFFTMLAITIYSLVYSIIACIKANEGVWYTYPFSIKFVGRAPGSTA